MVPDKDYFFATNLFINVSDPNISNIELYKISDELEKLDSVTIDIKGKFISYDLIHKNDSIIIISMRDTLMEGFSSGQIFIYDEFLNLVDSSSLLLPDVSGSRTFRFNLQEDKMGSYFLHATILNINMQDFILYSAKLDSNFEVQEFNKFSLRDGAIEASNVVKLKLDPKLFKPFAETATCFFGMNEVVNFGSIFKLSILYQYYFKKCE